VPRNETPTATACLTTAEGKFGTAFGKAESKGGCLTTNDAAWITAAMPWNARDDGGGSVP